MLLRRLNDRCGTGAGPWVRRIFQREKQKRFLFLFFPPDGVAGRSEDVRAGK